MDTMALTPTAKKEIKQAIRLAASTNSRRIHVIYLPNQWVLKNEGAKSAFKSFPTKSEAVESAKLLVRKGKARQVVIHTKQGQVAK
jgi:hypothetical protein